MNTAGKIALHEGIHQQVDKGNADILFIGDSITQRWANEGATVFAQYFGEYDTINMGIGGDATQSVLWRLQDYDLSNISPDVVVLQVGTNNLCWPSRGECYGHDTPQDTADGVQANVDYLRQALPDTQVLLLGLFPRQQDAAGDLRNAVIDTNQLIRSASDDQYVHYMDVGDLLLESKGEIAAEIMFDYLHLTDDGYRIVAAAIAPTIHQLMAGDDASQAISSDSVIGDVDGDGTIGGLSDGILIARFLAGFRGDALIEGVVNSGAIRSDADSISRLLQSQVATALDIDANGRSTALGDGILAIRYMAGFEANALTDSAVDRTNGTRTKPQEVTDHLGTLIGKTSRVVAAGPIPVEIGPMPPTSRRLAAATLRGSQVESQSTVSPDTVLDPRLRSFFMTVLPTVNASTLSQ
ncbi:GDSL-type esterase/lipase family protein [bacterium]|nr:GDSL-type esterase/lipase family protein [bacterium]